MVDLKSISSENSLGSRNKIKIVGGKNGCGALNWEWQRRK
jgi:hypothetical protein